MMKGGNVFAQEKAENGIYHPITFYEINDAISKDLTNMNTLI